MKIDLSLSNAALYAGCEIETVAGPASIKTPRTIIKTPVADAVNLVGINIEHMLSERVRADNQDVTLTGPMDDAWAYLVVFHAVLHRFNRVHYDDGRSGPVLIAAAHEKIEKLRRSNAELSAQLKATADELAEMKMDQADIRRWNGEKS